MFGKSKKKPKNEEHSMGGFEYEIPDEVIDADIDEYPYVMGKLKDC